MIFIFPCIIWWFSKTNFSCWCPSGITTLICSVLEVLLYFLAITYQLRFMIAPSSWWSFVLWMHLHRNETSPFHYPVCRFPFVSVYMSVNVYVRVCIFMFVYVYVYLYVSLYLYICIFVYICTCMFVYIYVYIFLINLVSVFMFLLTFIIVYLFILCLIFGIYP